MGHPRYGPDEIARRGKEIYDQRLREQLEPGCVGKFIVIDVETGEYVMDDDDVLASRRASLRNPGNARYGMRIGYSTSGTIGNALGIARR